MTKPSEGRSPNILFAIADDASHFGAYRHRFVKTPCIDALAREGVLFTQAFTTNPKCAPSRASILTGKHTWQLEKACNHFSLFPGKFAVYPDVLESAGYHVGYTGKGWAPGDCEGSGRRRNPAGNHYGDRKLTPPAQTMLYVRNFEPERWPAGNPETGFTNCDSSPTKRRVLALKEEGETRCFDLAFGKRPAEELYDLRADVHCLENLAGKPGHAAAQAELAQLLENTLRETRDPRIAGQGDIFETYPYVGEAQHSWANFVAGTWEPQKF